MQAFRWLILAVIPVATACEVTTPLEPAPALPLIHAVLNPAADSQLVYVAGTRGTLQAARATISNGSRVVELVQRTDTGFDGSTSTGPFVLPTFNSANRLQPGAEYQLDVYMANGTRVTSVARVPDVVPNPVVESASHQFGDPLTIDWSRIPGVSRYYVTVSVGGEFGRAAVITQSRFANSAFVLTQAELNLADGFTMSSTFFVSVSVVDEHFDRYFSIRSDPFSGTVLPTQFSNAYGVFGAIVPVLRTRYTLKFNGSQSPPVPQPSRQP
jgi:hypothetical protein